MPRRARTQVPPLSRLLTTLSLMAGSVVALAREPVVTPVLATRLRRPVSLLDVGEWLVVGNRRSGTITVIEPGGARIVAEHVVGKRIADMAGLDDGRHVLLIDDADGKLLKARPGAASTPVQSIAEIPATASKLAVARDRHRVFITEKWSHRVLAIPFDSRYEKALGRESIALPFAPLELLLVNGDRTLLVADAFGGRLAVIDAEGSGAPVIRQIEGHNIRGLALGEDGKRLYVAHQHMADRARADYEELHWGRMLSNAVEVFDIDEVLNGPSRYLRDGWLDRQGGIGSAMADPGGVVTGPAGTMAVAFSGVGEVVIRTREVLKRIAVQARPEAMVIRGERLFVANRFDDSVSVIDLERAALVATISLGPAPRLTAVDRGEKLFYDARISHDGWLSCHSCHTDGHSSGLLVDTLGDGDYGAPKRIPSLLGTRDTAPWGWTGSAASLAEQVGKSVTTTMHGGPLTESQRSDLVAYLESLEPPPPPRTARRERIDRGRALFESQGCADCHSPPTFTSDDTFDVGLSDERHRRAFNPPSLRGVSQRDRLFHDGRAASLEDVLLEIRHQRGAPLSKEAVAALLAYLRSL